MLAQLITPASLLAGLIERLRSGKSSIHSNAPGSVGSSLVHNFNSRHNFPFRRPPRRGKGVEPPSSASLSCHVDVTVTTTAGSRHHGEATRPTHARTGSTGSGSHRDRITVTTRHASYGQRHHDDDQRQHHHG